MDVNVRVPDKGGWSNDRTSGDMPPLGLRIIGRIYDRKPKLTSLFSTP